MRHGPGDSAAATQRMQAVVRGDGAQTWRALGGAISPFPGVMTSTPITLLLRYFPGHSIPIPLQMRITESVCCRLKERDTAIEERSVRWAWRVTQGAGLEGHADCDADTRVSLVVHVIAIVSVDNVNVVGFIPVACPGVGPRINKAEPIAAVLKTRESADNHIGLTKDHELMA